MAFVLKGNRQLTVLEEKIPEFLAMGYSEIDKEGEILQVGQATDLKDIKAENDTLKAELVKYQSINLEEVEAIKAENEALQVGNTTLKEGLDALNPKYETLEKENEDLKAQLEAATKKK